MSGSRRPQADRTPSAEPVTVPDLPPAPADASFDPVASSLNLDVDTPASPRSLAIGGAVVAAAILLLVASRRRRSR